MDKEKIKNVRRLRRRQHNRNKLRGSADIPRMSVCRSNKHIYCQLIDDENGKTIVSVSTRDTSVRDDVKVGGNCDAATKVGQLVAEKAKASGVARVRFDRGHVKYHGRVAALADAAREGGLQF